MTSVLKPEITSIINGLLTITVRSVTQVGAVFNQLLIFRASSANGPFSQIIVVSLDGSASYTYLDTATGPGEYYRAQYYNNSTLVSSQYSEIAQETGVFSEYTVPTSSATYPPEIALSVQDREIVESIRITLGDLGSIERDYYSSSDSQSQFYCSAQISADQCTWELKDYKGWPQRVLLNGGEKTSLSDPQVIGYKYLTFSGGGSPCITGTLDVFYNHFRFADREILLAYDRANNLLVSCGLTTDQITTEMRIMQAAILLLEGEFRDVQQGAIAVRDGDTSYDNTRAIQSRTQDLDDLKQKIRELIACARANAAYALEGVRLD